MGLEGARQYVKDIRARKGDGAFTDVEIEEMLVKAYSMGFVTALEMTDLLAERGAFIRIDRKEKNG